MNKLKQFSKVLEKSEKIDKVELNEITISDSMTTFLTYKFLLMLKTPFKEWDAFKLGIINENGDKIKPPKTKEEKKSLDKLLNLIRKIKKILGKYIPSEKLLSFIVTVYLLKESPNNETYNDLSCKLRNNLTEEESNMLLDILRDRVL